MTTNIDEDEPDDDRSVRTRDADLSVEVRWCEMGFHTLAAVEEEIKTSIGIWERFNSWLRGAK